MRHRGEMRRQGNTHCASATDFTRDLQRGWATDGVFPAPKQYFMCENKDSWYDCDKMVKSDS